MVFYGNKDVLKLLKYLILNPKNAIQFKGPKGVGKYTIAKKLSKKLLCFSPKVKICHCESCSKFNLDSHPDLITVFPQETSIKKEQILEIKKESMKQSLVSKRKFFIIDDANLMTESAQNSLLKIIESGYKFNHYIFVSHGNLLSTVESRTDIYQFNPLADSIVEEYLSVNCGFEKNQDLRKSFIIAASQGSIGTAKTLYDSSEFHSMFPILAECFNLHQLSTLDTFRLFGQLKEKDKNNFYMIYEEYIYEFLLILKVIFMDYVKAKVGDKRHIFFESNKESLIGSCDNYSIKILNHIIYEIDKSMNEIINKKYSKNDFFDLIRRITSIIHSS